MAPILPPRGRTYALPPWPTGPLPPIGAWVKAFHARWSVVEGGIDSGAYASIVFGPAGLSGFAPAVPLREVAYERPPPPLVCSASYRDWPLGGGNPGAVVTLSGGPIQSARAVYVRAGLLTDGVQGAVYPQISTDGLTWQAFPTDQGGVPWVPERWGVVVSEGARVSAVLDWQRCYDYEPDPVNDPLPVPAVPITGARLFVP